MWGWDMDKNQVYLGTVSDFSGVGPKVVPLVWSFFFLFENLSC